MNPKTTPEEPPRLPILLDPVSNGEVPPGRPSARLRTVQRLASERAEEAARRRGVPRRGFLRSTCGAATVLLAMNQVLGCRAGRFALAPDAAEDEDAAAAALEGGELVFDVQTHHVSTERPWAEDNDVLAPFLREQQQADCGEPDWVRCYSRDRFLKEVFLDSDTRLGVLSMLPGLPSPLETEEAVETREALARAGTDRLRVHGVALPNHGELERALARMDEQAARWELAAFKLYPVWGPEGRGYRLDEEAGLRTIERALSLGVPRIAAHKGLPLVGMDAAYTAPLDVGPAARAFPEARLLVYHSGYEPDVREGPYDPTATRGVDALIRTVEEHDLGHDGNVWAELGSTWHAVMRDPEQAAHVLGKLLKHVGEDRVLWGTDCIWYGSPQDQIQAFRAFEISEELQDRYGYPALTPERKAKILGRNALAVYDLDPAAVEAATADDDVARARTAYRERPRPSHVAYGPRTRRELLALVRSRGGLPS